ncbi:VOC family protein [Pseudofrankia inefficax]|uniref:Glyoxalase/bleomycin resistance protein/dioxygenase n=1 Tax=Pseudofrankia inefficax (strain DSM 45817 / CECT 9037 / DDB 130130 / EuI1c) TaxID=298654 RepID=E3IVE5_PSEI1|nr:VOC family protein [Pseudofrankia inefficax]ADP81309.1 Glyoxalase/bleomycin resistance protein/dioxygenase [Pseudofrankia inefficax]
MITAFGHVGHCVSDLARARRFYEGLLGFTYERELTVPDDMVTTLLDVEAPANLTAVYLRLDGLVLELLHFDRPVGLPPPRRRFDEPGLTHLSLRVSDLAAVARQVEAYGGEVLPGTPAPDRVLMIRDPDGQRVELVAARG